MYKEPMDLVQNVEWEEMPKKRVKRPCTYLADDRETKINKALLVIPPVIEKLAIKETNTEKNRSNFDLKPFKAAAGRVFCLSPSVIIGYMHVVLNGCVISLLLYSLFYLIYFARIDIKYKISQSKEEARVLIDEAKRLYVLNRCDPSTRVPGMDNMCGQWDVLIRSGLSGVRYMRIVAEMFADVLDGFVAKFSYKSLATILVMTGVYLVFRR